MIYIIKNQTCPHFCIALNITALLQCKCVLKMRTGLININIQINMGQNSRVIKIIRPVLIFGMLLIVCCVTGKLKFGMLPMGEGTAGQER